MLKQNKQMEKASEPECKTNKTNFQKKRALKPTVAIKDFSAPHVQLKVALQMHFTIAFSESVINDYSFWKSNPNVPQLIYDQ